MAPEDDPADEILPTKEEWEEICGHDGSADCETCGGNGWVDDPSDGGTMTCPDCEGSGKED